MKPFCRLIRPAVHRWTSALTLLLLLGLLPLSRPARAGDLEKQIVKHSAEVMKYLQSKGYQNVGVLKFRVKKGSEPVSDRVGTLNGDLSDQLEMALVLAIRPAHEMGIIHDANAVAAKIRGASHLTAEGRQKFFDAKYPLAWGNAKVTPDAFVTGVAIISADLKEITVGIVGFDKTGTELEKIAQFTAKMDPSKLSEAGESFVLRGVFDQGNIEQVALNDAAKTHEAPKENPPPVQAADAPVDLQISYNGKPVAVEVRDGKTFVREPEEGEQVLFTLKRKNPKDANRYAVVLKVNGENTLGKQKLHDLQCRKWVLEPKDPPIVVRGYQLDNNQAEAFRVLSKAESKSKEIDYGQDVGQISLVVFKEQKGPVKPPSDLPSDDAEDIAALTRSVFPAKPAENLAALQAQFRADGARGLISQGEKIGSAVTTVKFEADPVPVMTQTIVYYKAQ
ncbi:MAG TPA: hypothetical protein VFE24_03605 [Pirellulales bacterium]|jgi:hypothetical protein|nr:hypothetical protein [Pirellulales bacterium]